MHELTPWLRLIFRHRGRLVIGAALLFATLLSGIALLALSGWFLTKTALTGLLFAAGIQAYINLYVPGGGIRFFAVSRTVARYAERLYNHNTVLQLLTDIRVALFGQLARAGRAFRSHRTGAQWLSRLTADVDAPDTLYLRLIAPAALAAIVTFLMIALAWFVFSGTLALILSAILVPALILATWVPYLRTRTLSGQFGDQQEVLRGQVIEHLEGFSELIAAGRAGKHAALLMRNALALSHKQAEVDTRVGWHLALTVFLVNLSAVAALWFGFGLYQAGEVSGPVLVLLPIALLGLGEAYSTLPEAFGRLGATVAAAWRLNGDGQPAMPASSPSRPVADSTTVLVADKLGVGYPGHAPVISHFSLRVEPGERLGVLGASGCGKSTLADTLAGVIAPLSGELFASPGAYLTQATVVFDDTLRDNLMLGRPDATDAELWEVLELVGLAGRFDHEPEGLDTWLGSSGNRLSGGEARRVALARVLLSRAPLVLLDEPFTGVDSETISRIAPRVDQWLGQRAVICFGHGPEAILSPDRTVHLT